MFTTHAENILAVYSRGSLAQIRTGASWYDDRHAAALDLSSGDVWRAAGVIAAYSPVNKWPRNIEMATDSLRSGIARADYLPVMVAQAQRILDGEHALSVLNGDKVRAFASAIADPHNSTIATIDRHAHDIAMGRVYTDKERKIGKRLFRELAAAYTIAARETGFSVAQIQAIAWVIWRDEK